MSVADDTVVDDYVAEAQRLMQEAPPAPPQLEALGGVLLGEFKQAAVDRRETEERWLKDLRQYRGQYDADVLAKLGANRSKTFVRKTRVKVKTVDARVMDLLFPAGRDKNYSVEETERPSISADQKIEIRKLIAARLQQAAAAAQQQGQPAPQKPTRQMFEAAVKEWAKERAGRMSSVIDDQLGETRYKQIVGKAVHSGHLYGTGIVKGPLVERKVRTRFIKQGDKWLAQHETYVTPFLDFVPVWRFYPDMSVTEHENCRFVYERHQMTKSDMADLARRKSFKGEVIVAHVLANPSGLVEDLRIDNELRSIGDRQTSMTDPRGKYEVLERWGYLDGVQLRDAGVQVPDERLHESFFSNVWLLPNGQIIKAVLQPINGVTWPYHLYYCDKDESSIFGEGFPSIMRDEQTSINSATRLMQDNAAITVGANLEITPTLLASTEKIDDVSPWRIWLRNATSPGQRAVNVVEFPSRLADLSAIKQMAEANADEVTAVPRYMSGENAVSGAAGTATGLSMLMGNVNIVVKELVTNFDEGVTLSFIRGMYHWNMQFNPDDSIKGDFNVKATATASLVAKEVRARALNEFGQMTANPLDAPFIKRDVLNRQRAEANELQGVVKTEEEVRADQESEIAKMQQQIAIQQQQLALAEAQAKIAKITAEAELSQMRAKEALANIDVLIAKAVATRVEAAYAGLQAGGVATSSPHIAPAGDEILRSSGWKDATPDPSIAQLNGPPVQPGPVPPGAVPQPADGNATHPDPANVPQPATQPAAPGLQPQTGMVGRRAGIETAEIE